MSYLSDERKKQFRAFRRVADDHIESVVDSPAVINGNMDVLRSWIPGVYAIGDVRLYDGNPYKCVQAHDSTGNDTWNPVATPALWVHYHGTTPETARPFVQEGHNPYMNGHYCIENGSVYLCGQDNVVYAPSVYPIAWTQVS